ncbi:MAG: LAGLIDADG family homing endonuclease, partial [Candidatus Woesearchaeota archaeon]
MVLEKLGSNLKDTLNKITRSLFVDEKLVNELVKDIQRALLQSDVNVKLVLELSKELKEKAMKKDIPSGLSRKEYLINAVYETLVKFLGGEGHKIEIKKKPFKIMLVGLFGNGKCVHKDSMVLLSNGQSISAKELYDKYSYKEVKIEDGFIVPLNNEVFVPSFNQDTLKIENKKVDFLWKLNSKELIKVNLDNGNDSFLRTTPEHPFFLLENGNIIQKRADELIEGDYIAVPSKIIIKNNKIDLFNEIKNYDLLIKHNPNEIKKYINESFGNIKNALKKSSISLNYEKFTIMLKKGIVPIDLYPFYKKNIQFKLKSSVDFIKFPREINTELSEFIGYVIGDGYIAKKSVCISNEDNEIIQRISYLTKKLFNKKATITIDKRNKNLKSIRINSVTLVYLLNHLFNIPIGKKGINLRVPELIQKSDDNIVSTFIRAYFDCDAHFFPSEREIEVTSESKFLLKDIQHLLLRFIIISSLSSKKIKGKFYYRSTINGRHTVYYKRYIYSLIKRKQISLENYETITLKQGDGKKDIIPIGSLLKDLRNNRGLSINQIQKHVSSYGLYESKGFIFKTQLQKVIEFYDKKEEGNFFKIINNINNKDKNELINDLGRPLFNALIGELKNKNLVKEVTNSPTKIVLTKEGIDYSNNFINDNKLEKLNLISSSDLSWIKIKSTEKIENDYDYVYDLTVQDNHNFVCDGAIIHNTTTSGKLARYFSKRGHKVALIQTDTWRPAAYDQLKQIAESLSINFFGDKEEKDPNKIYKKYENELNKHDIIIIDTAGRDALSNDLIKELDEINKTVNADERLLVIGADVGQAAQKQAEAFHETCNVTGVIITKLDGTAKGGGALVACSITNAPVKFIGVGEKTDALEEFKPKGFVGRLLGMGDLEALLDKAKEAIDEDEAKDLGKKFLKGEFSLIDLYEQMEAMKKMGPLTKVMDMIPGMGNMNIPKDMLKQQEGKLKTWRFIMDSCTKEELEDPDIIHVSRIERIAKGSGRSVTEVRELLKQYKQSKKVMKMMKGKGKQSKQMQQMMKQMGNMPM